MKWIRVSTAIMDNSRVDQMAMECGVRVAEAAGLILGVLTHLPDESRDGDVSPVSNRLIERWACWEGTPGVFADAFRWLMCNEHGVVRSWERYNGKAMRDADKASERSREWRDKRVERKEAKPTSTPEETLKTHTRMHTEPDPVCIPYAYGGQDAYAYRTDYVTGRDVTVRTTTTEKRALDADAPPAVALVPDVAVPPRPRPKPRATAATKYPGFTAPVCDAAYDLWLERAGAVEYGQFRKAFGPLFARADADRPDAQPRDAELVPLIRLYLAAIRGTSSAKFVSPTACAKVLSQLTAAHRQGDSPERQLVLAQHALGLTDEVRRLSRAAGVAA